jgi:hypothetical protein
MKKMLLLVALLVAVSAAAQGPVSHIGQNVLVPGSPAIMSVPFNASPAKTPPYCGPCLFYTGDFNANGSGADGVDNEEGGSLGGGEYAQEEYAEVYDGMIIPKGYSWTITKLFINTLSSESSGIDPTETWDIRTGVSSGNGGKSVDSGTGKDTFKATGRTGFGYNEYTNLVTLKNKVVLKAGVYYMDVLTGCTTSSCSGGEFFETDQEIEPSKTKCMGANCFGPPQGWDDSYFNSNYFGIAWENTIALCGSGYCDQFSVGATGTAKKD